MDFSLSALRFIVAVSFFGFNVHVLDSRMNERPLEFPAFVLRRNCVDVESKLYGLTDETTECCETETQRDHAGPDVQVHDAILIRFCCLVDKLCITAA
jgi:hypothetical protein